MKIFLTVFILTLSTATSAGTFHFFCEHQMPIETDDFDELHYLTKTFSYSRPYARYCTDVDTFKIKESYQKHLRFIDGNVTTEGFTSCDCFEQRRDVKKSYLQRIRNIRVNPRASLRLIHDFPYK